MSNFKIKKNLQIAIDGPVAAGKGTIASILSKKLKILYVYTGAMYRAVGYLAKKNGLDYQNEKGILKFLKKTKIILKPAFAKNRLCRVYLNNEEVTDKLFTQEASWGASAVGILPEVRKELVNRQKEIARGQSVIMEGRDIATRVLSDADLKIYLTASVLERAKRRLKQLEKEGIKANLSKVIEETKKRDNQDIHRKADPLQIVKDAYFLDTTKLSINKVVDKILTRLKKNKLIS